MRKPQIDLLDRLELFHGTTRRQRRAVSHLGTVLDLPGGRVLAPGSELSRQLFVVVDGVVQLTRNGVARSMLLPGDWWSDAAASSPSSRDELTAIAIGAIRVLVYGRRELDALLRQCPPVAQRLRHTETVRTLGERSSTSLQTAAAGAHSR